MLRNLCKDQQKKNVKNNYDKLQSQRKDYNYQSLDLYMYIYKKQNGRDITKQAKSFIFVMFPQQKLNIVEIYSESEKNVVTIITIIIIMIIIMMIIIITSYII